MSDDFIPLSQSTPTGGSRWQNNGRNRNKNLPISHYNNKSSPRRWGKNLQRNCSFGSDSNNSSYGQDRNSIDAYLHPSMLQDPWAQLRKKMESSE